ncbi:MAG: protein phosphatase 2C domain-containing protein [Pyrinomonadaceae bacterium]
MFTESRKRFSFSRAENFPEQSPAMILLSTDGYLNSFSSEAGFFQAATDIQDMLRAENGFDAVSENLKGWLEEATQMGSGDDCTVGIIYRPDALKKSEITETSKKSEKPETTTKTETPPSPETTQAIAALTDSTAATTSENMEDVTVTITIKKDKNKISAPTSVALAEEDSAQTKTATDKSNDKQSK